MKNFYTALLIAAVFSFHACSKSPESAEKSATPTPATQAPTAKFGKWGVDLATMDSSIKPGDDFFKYVNGKWLASNTIPPDLTRWGVDAKLAIEAEKQIHDLIEALPDTAAAGSPEQKVRDFYRSFVDVDAIEKSGLDPARKGLTEIAAAKTHSDVARLMGRPDLSLDTPINIGISIDEKNPDRYIVGISQAGLSLPDRDYYLKDDKALAEIRTQFLAHLEHMLKLGGEDNAAAQAKTIFDLETKIAKLHWPVEKRRERELTYNLRTRDQLDKMAGNYPWQEILAAGGLQDQKEFVVAELDAVQALGKFFTTVPVDAWRSYMKYHYLAAHASVLPKALDDENFDFYGRVLSGREEKRERWKRGVQALEGSVGEVVGQVYVKKYFPPESKQQVLDLVNNLRAAYTKRIQNAPWMSDATKKVAMEKLQTFRPKIGYPDKWKDYSELEVKRGDAFGNTERANVFAWNFDLHRLGKKTDRDEWFMTPQTVNAYYNPTFNEIVFPAAILQPPYFDPHADAAVNYGAIGGLIGHEMGHGFDDQGAKSDAYGVLRNWWQPADEKAFKKLVDVIVKQYNAYEALPGLKLNGQLTAGENIGDLGGLNVAHEAYLMSLNGKEPPVLDGITGEQRFFLGYAQSWCEMTRDAALRNQVISNPHSPAEFRVNGVVRNMDAWYAAFGVKPENKLFFPEKQRLHIW
ncbi:MAG TPA: M13 family metallopeptidase [Steroidobacteraceae bacterium]|nr:M13 family metallopeptidase [Steroidobacteraceae bacterium]